MTGPIGLPPGPDRKWKLPFFVVGLLFRIPVVVVRTLWRGLWRSRE